MTLPDISIDLADPGLFGNDNAEDEDSQILQSYLVDRPELDRFLDPKQRIAIVSANKGEGKSALLRQTGMRLQGSQKSASDIVIQAAAADFNVQGDKRTSDDWLLGWKNAILKRIAAEIGARIGFAITDDNMRLVEESQSQGVAKIGIISMLASRVKPSLGGVGFSRPTTSNHGALLQRYLSGGVHVWVIIDDVDLNFQDTNTQRVRTANLFSACRAIANSLPDVRFRLSVRPYVWSILRQEFEDLNKSEQYVYPLSWTLDGIRDILFARIRAYLRRQRGSLPILTPNAGEEQPDPYLRLVFESPMHGWGKGRLPHIPLATMSWYRPRWLIELCRESGMAAHQNKHQVIRLVDLENRLPRIGERRFHDVVSEFSIRCPEIGRIILEFRDQPDRLETEALISLIQNKVVPIGVTIDRKSPSGVVEICDFLYQIGFVGARIDGGSSGYFHHNFAAYPTLMRAAIASHSNQVWEIPHVFRTYLGLQS